MRCVNIDANNRKRFYACITFDAIIRNEKTLLSQRRTLLQVGNHSKIRLSY